MSVRIKKQHLPDGPERLLAGYDDIGLQMAIEFLDYNAREQADDRPRLIVKDTTRQIDGETHHERTLCRGDEPALRLWLVFD